MGDACAAFEAIAYAADPERVRLDLEAYRARLPEGGRLSAAMRPTLPDCDSSENLAAKLRLAAELGLERVDLYHYGFAPLERARSHPRGARLRGLKGCAPAQRRG